jgi:hypothetical protein
MTAGSSGNLGLVRINYSHADKAVDDKKQTGWEEFQGPLEMRI